jgi:hypothetical protein
MEEGRWNFEKGPSRCAVTSGARWSWNTRAQACSSPKSGLNVLAGVVLQGIEQRDRGMEQIGALFSGRFRSAADRAAGEGERC